MSKKLKIRFYQLILAFLTIFCVHKPVGAVDLTVSPANNYVRVDGGEETLLDYTLINQENIDVQVSLAAQSFRPDDTDGRPILIEALDFPYVSLVVDGEAAESVIVPAGGERDVQVKVAPPLGMEVREYPLTLFFTVMQPGETVQSGSALGMQVGSNLIVSLDTSNEDKSNLSLLVPDLSYFVDTLMSQHLPVKVINHGPFGTLIHGNVSLRLGEREVAHWDFYPDLVLGESSRLARVSDGSVDGNGKISLNQEVVLPRYLLGYYTLEVYVSSINETDGVGNWITMRFLALPYWLILLVLVVVLILVVVKKVTAKKSRSTRARKQLAKMRQQRAYFK